MLYEFQNTGHRSHVRDIFYDVKGIFLIDGLGDIPYSLVIEKEEANDLHDQKIPIKDRSRRRDAPYVTPGHESRLLEEAARLGYQLHNRIATEKTCCLSSLGSTETDPRSPERRS